MPEKFEALAVYNAERHRGLIHAAEYAAHMAKLQAEFDEWQHDDLCADGFMPDGSGRFWVRPPRPKWWKRFF